MKEFIESFRISTLGRSVNVLSNRDQKKLLAIVLIQITLGGLDLLGVIAIGLLGALSVTGIQSNDPSDRVSSALNFLQISQFTFHTQIVILALSAVIFFIGRTVLSVIFTRRALFFLSRRGAEISTVLVSRLLSQSLLKVQARSTQETLFAVTRGVELIVLQVLATTIVLISDLSLLLVMAVGLFIVDATTAFGTVLTFSTIGFFLYRLMNVRASSLGTISSELNISSNEKIIEVFSSYRESVVRNRRDYYAREIRNQRFALADTSAEISFMPYVSKYVIESCIVISALLISATQFILQDASQAVATLAIFLAAGTRIAPAVLRVQQASVQIRGSIGAAKPTLDLIEELEAVRVLEKEVVGVDVIHDGFSSEIVVSKVSLTYPERMISALSDVSFNIAPGTFVAVVGSSGAGKTTLIDVLLGLLCPDEGSVLISGASPQLAVVNWPGAISYVPQDIVISSGTIRQNVALGYPIEEATDELVMSALKIAHLLEFVENLPKGLDTQVGERGTKISGGQRQRLGIARALFTRPKLLVLDEATSALDGETEASISDAIQTLRGSTTVVMIAHRLSTVRNADVVLYLSEGKVICSGSFEEVRIAVPDFDRQAKLMGL